MASCPERLTRSLTPGVVPSRMPKVGAPGRRGLASLRSTDLTRGLAGKIELSFSKAHLLCGLSSETILVSRHTVRDKLSKLETRQEKLDQGQMRNILCALFTLDPYPDFMDLFFKLLEKILSTLVLALIFGFISFSYTTGKFPPSKEDLSRAVKITRQLFSGAKDYNKAIHDIQSSTPTLEQMVEFQRLQLRRTEMTLELTKIFKHLQLQQPSPQLSEKLQGISEQMSRVEQDLQAITSQIEKSL